MHVVVIVGRQIEKREGFRNLLGRYFPPLSPFLLGSVRILKQFSIFFPKHSCCALFLVIVLMLVTVLGVFTFYANATTIR